MSFQLYTQPTISYNKSNLTLDKKKADIYTQRVLLIIILTYFYYKIPEDLILYPTSCWLVNSLKSWSYVYVRDNCLYKLKTTHYFDQ